MPALRSDLATSGKYFEPFVGGGAAFFSLNPSRAVLSDLNGELIETYRCIRDNPADFALELRRHAQLHSTEHYYQTRESRPDTALERAARFVYLNRTCWNGLYRVNRMGVFNVPIGTKSNVLLSTDDWHAISDRLSSAALLAQDFETTIDCANRGDVVFADPPYTVKHNFNGFVKYNESIFSWEDQERLSKCLKAAANRGVTVIATNAAHESVKSLYNEGFSVTTVKRASVLAGDAAARGKYEELLITANYC